MTIIVRCALMSRVGRGTTTTFERDDAFAGLGEEVRGSETSDPPLTATTSASTSSTS